MSIVYFMIGPSCSGKTPFVEKSFNQQDYYIISFDRLYSRLCVAFDYDYEFLSKDAHIFIRSEIERLIKIGNKGNTNVVLDMRNLTVAARKKRLDFFDERFRRIAYVFPTPSETARKYFNGLHWFGETYSNKRLQEIDDSVAKFEYPRLEEGFDELRPWYGGI